MTGEAALGRASVLASVRPKKMHSALPGGQYSSPQRDISAASGSDDEITRPAAESESSASRVCPEASMTILPAMAPVCVVCRNLASLAPGPEHHCAPWHLASIPGICHSS